MDNEIKVMNNDEIRDFCIKKDLKIFELEQENEKLNNIINELEKYLQENINNIYAYFDNAPFGVEETYKEVLSKLQELKGVNK